MLENTFLRIQFRATILNRIIVYVKTYHYQLGRIATINLVYGFNIIIIKPDVQL